MDQPVVTRLERLVSAALVRSGCSDRETSLVIGVSGGPDSSALLYCLHRIRELHQLRLHVAHLNHDFRGEEAEADARFVSAIARELELPVTVEKRDPMAYQRTRGISSFEQGARELRYSFLAQVARDVGADAVAVGHTADDQAETVLLHILRGAGLHGLRGMTETSPWPWPPEVQNLVLLRPLLEAAKQDTAAYCRALGREFREDSGNYLPQFTRNRVRHELVPLLATEYNPQVRKALTRLARTTARELDYLEEETDRVWPTVVSAPEDRTIDSVKFNRRALSALHPALQSLVLRRGYSQLAGDTRRLRENQLQGMTNMVSIETSGRALTLPGGLTLHSVYDHLLLSRDSVLPCPFPLLEGEQRVTLPAAPGQAAVTELDGWRIVAEILKPTLPVEPPPSPSLTAHFDPAALSGEVSVRSRRPGDRFQPLGMTHQKKLQDFFTDARVPRSWRDRVPLLVSPPGIAWVVGHRIAHWSRVKERETSDSAVLRVTFDHIND